MNIDEVAKKAGVSKSSVSRFFSENNQYMSEKMKEKITLAIQELNFSPNAIAQSLKTKKSKVLGIMLTDISHPFWADVLKGAQQEGAARGYSIMVTMNPDDDTDLEKSHITMLRQRQVDGLIIHSAGENTEMLERLQKEGFPFVLLYRTFSNLTADTVVVNDLLGARKATQHLVDQGHRRIAVLSYPEKNLSTRKERIEGYKQVLKENNIPLDPGLIKICEEKKGHGVAAAEQLLLLEDPPTAIFSTGLLLSLELLTGLKKMKKRIPRDVSVISYDDAVWVSLLDTPLSTVVQPAYQMGVEAVSLLIERITQGGEREAKTVQLNPDLAVRASCSRPSLKNLPKRTKEE